MVAKFTNQPKNKEVVTKINDVIDAIPTVNNATLTIQKNGTTVKTFTANASSNVTCNITVPTQTSDLTNNSGFVTTDTQDTCGATNSTEKLYLVGRTAQSTGTSNSNSSVYTQSGYLYAKTPSASSNTTSVATTAWVTAKGYTTNTGTVTKVNNTSPDANGNVSITIPTVPTNVSAFTNDSNYIANIATGTNSLTINGTATSATSSVNIGATSTAGGGYSVAVGYYAASNGARTTSIGYGARIGSSTADAIQIGNGTNSTAKTLSIGFYNTGNYTLLDGTTGLIPLDRIAVMGGAGSSSAGTKGLVPAPASGDNSKFLRGDGTWQSVSAGSGANIDLSNLSATGKLVLDGQPTSLDQIIINSDTSLKGSSDLGAYTVNVPNDGQKYELLLQCQIRTTATVGQWLTLRIHSSIHWLDVIQVTAQRAAVQDWTVSCKIYIDSDRKFWISRSTSFNGSVTNLKVMSYRRIGTNS